MNDAEHEMAAPARAHSDVPARRACLRCGSMFQSEGFGQRICPACKATVSWKSAVPSRAGHTRHR